MLVDLHAHFPMHLLADEQQRTHERARIWWRQRWQGRVVELISRFANYQGPGDTPSVTEQLMRDGDVGVALSVLYQPFDEMDLTESYGAPPRAELLQRHRRPAPDGRGLRPTPTPARSRSRTRSAELDALLGARRPDPDPRDRGRVPARARAAPRSAETCRRWPASGSPTSRSRTCSSATWRPTRRRCRSCPTGSTTAVFPRARAGLTSLGHEVIDAMVDEGILIDLTHMRAQSIRDVLAQLDARDPAKRDPGDRDAHGVPVRRSASTPSMTTRSPRWQRAAACSGCILCEHYITSGLHAIASTFEARSRRCAATSTRSTS